eukprot:gene22384-7557_t
MLICGGFPDSVADSIPDYDGAKVVASAMVDGPCDKLGIFSLNDKRVRRCFDVAACDAAASKEAGDAKQKFAIVLSHTLMKPEQQRRFRPEVLWSFTAWQKLGIDTI